LVPETKRAQTYGSFRQPPTASFAKGKVRRSIKLREVELVLRRAGLITLDEQARALGLSRTTTWKILRGNRKSFEPSAASINRILRAHAYLCQSELKFLNTFKIEFLGCTGTANLNRVDFRSDSDGARTRLMAGAYGIGCLAELDQDDKIAAESLERALQRRSHHSRC
jgi:transcriptional regulator with XRE-family HTH domain